ncbi:MAG: hypothetical protein WCC00_00730 [Candidatus Aminicenantales bacterium]
MSKLLLKAAQSSLSVIKPSRSANARKTSWIRSNRGESGGVAPGYPGPIDPIEFPKVVEVAAIGSEIVTHPAEKLICSPDPGPDRVAAFYVRGGIREGANDK